MKKTENIQLIQNAQFLTSSGRFQKGNLLIEKGKIKKISPNKPSTANLNKFDAGGYYVLPGFVELHVNGIGNCDITRDPQKSLNQFSLEMAKRGVTTFLPTLVSMPYSKLKNVLEKLTPFLKKPMSGAAIPGLHLEGPYIESKRKGAHSLKGIEKPSKEKLLRLIHASAQHIKLMTLAPEKDPKGEFASILRKNRIIPAMGHTDGNYSIGLKAIQSGYRYATHLFNAMHPWHHREPGLAGAALLDPQVICECIPDGNHLHFAVLEMIYKLKDKNKIIISSDEWVGRYDHKNNWIKKDGAFFDPKKKILTGSATSQFNGIKKWAQFSKRDWPELIPLATINPSKAIGISREAGSIDIGKWADIIVLDNKLNVKMTLVRGKIAYFHPNRSQKSKKT